MNGKRLIPYLFIVLMGVIVFLIPIGSADELWNYNFAKCISKGLLPYRDFSMVPTPLSACFPALLMLLFGRGLIIQRIAAYLLIVLLFSLLFYVSNLIYEDVIMSMMRSLFAMALLVLVYQYDYNHVMILELLIIYAVILKDKGHFTSLVTGFLSGLAILIKQNTGVAVFVVNAVICLFYVVKGNERKKYLFRFIISLIPGMLFLSYLWITQTLDDFWDYAIYGVTTFKQRISLVDQIRNHSVVGVFFLAFLFWVGVAGIRCVREKGNARSKELFLYALAGLSVVYPLCDAPHMIAGVIPMIPVLSIFAQKRLGGYGRLATITAVLCMCSMAFFTKLPIHGEIICSMPNYEGMYIKKDLEELLCVVNDYVMKKEAQQFRVRFADQSAAFFNIPMDTYEKNWDMLNIGNFGTNTIEGLLGEDHNYLYFVYRNEEDLGLQSHFELIHYIKKHYEKIDEVLCFDVYKSTN
ncbi:MAG: hypothetical protein IK081_13380 [Lachnospiraceae bacterium]|nr:hypothetical protein [Lachnospiraceae bacterium]